MSGESISITFVKGILLLIECASDILVWTFCGSLFWKLIVEDVEVDVGRLDNGDDDNDDDDNDDEEDDDIVIDWLDETEKSDDVDELSSLSDESVKENSKKGF